MELVAVCEILNVHGDEEYDYRAGWRGVYRARLGRASFIEDALY